MSAAAFERTTCYRHPGRETGVSCSSCGKPICPDCMTPTPVGMRCPECAKEKTKVRTPKAARRPGTGAIPIVVQAIVGICVVVWFGELATEDKGIDSLLAQGAVYGPAIGGQDEWWRIITGGFLHNDQMPGGVLHIGFNMYILVWLGRELEAQLGQARLVVVYLVCVVGGSLGALLLDPDAYTVGASGAVFGLMGVGLVDLRGRGIPLMQSPLAGLVALNLIITFAMVDRISVGGHIGGLATGLVVGFVMLELGRDRRMKTLTTVGCVALGVVLFVAAVLVARNPI